MLINKKDITDRNDVKILLDNFYRKVKQDDLLAPVFRMRIPDEEAWPAHMQVLYEFWESVLFGEIAFRGNPFPKHVGLGITSVHFDRWIMLFHGTIDEFFAGRIATEAKVKSDKMRSLFEFKLKSIDETGKRPLV
ncbi:MAG TPA: group III truncated hemoglobin [Flavitalea sp.]|nr:group III truncated hemoglobin [Flavitalea sp.]